MSKTTIMEVLGEKDLLLPELVHDALAANERAKYLFTLLQLARAHADAVDGSVPDLRSEREFAGIADERLDSVIGRSWSGRDTEYRVPFVKVIVERLFSDIDAMAAPLRAAPERFGADATAFDRRRTLLSSSCTPRSEGTIEADALALLTSSDRSRGDSAHLLVFDLHKAVDAVAASIATDDIDGAKAYGLSDADRPLVAAFMKGVHETEAVKLDHPGLGTMATRSGPSLIIENDIGETSAHVLVVRIEGLRLVVTSTDVHLQRLAFLQRMLEGFPIEWADVRSRSARELADVGLFYECVGTLDAGDRGQLERFLARLGSRLVFLIDWNRARKVLRSFAPKAAGIELLAAAADEGYGHRGLLEMGGEQLLLDTMASVVKTPLRFGERLDDILGAPAATEFLRFALRTCSVGLRQKRSPSLMRAEIRAALSKAVETGGERLLAPLVDHASLVVEMATALRAQIRGLGGAADASMLVEAAKDREHRADEVVILVRGMGRRIPEAATYYSVIELADDAADALEEATFLFSLVPRDAASAFGSAELEELGDLVVATAEVYARCVASARRTGAEALHGVLLAFDEIARLEHRMDDAQRRFVASVAREPAMTGKLFVMASRGAGEMEQAVDALTHAALLLRDHVTSAC
jgi:uncharacterized protein Yka (UPF0111/DUF47 family)